MIKYFLILLLLPGWLCGAKKVFDLELPSKKFIKLNVFERAQYKKAYALVKKGNFKAHSWVAHDCIHNASRDEVELLALATEASK